MQPTFLSEGEGERSRLGHFKRFETGNQGESQCTLIQTVAGLRIKIYFKLKFSENEGEMKVEVKVKQQMKLI